VADVEGRAADDLEALRAELAATFVGDAEAGGALAVVVDGEVRAHLWGGRAGEGKAWAADTVCPVFSATKLLAAATVAWLHDTGRLDVHEPLLVGRRGDGPTVADVLAHRSGHPALTEPASLEEALDPERMGERVVAQPPEWGPGEAHGYHALTFGWLLDAAVRSRTGRSVGSHLAELAEIVGGIEARIGTPVEFHPRVAAMARARRASPDPADGPAASVPVDQPDQAELAGARLAAALAVEGSLPQRALTWPPLLAHPAVLNRPDVLAAEVASVNGTATATALATLAGELATDRQLRPSVRALLVGPGSEGDDRVLLGASRFGLGVMLPGPLFGVPSPTAFGHTGVSGSIVVADPAHGLGFAYVTRSAGTGLEPDRRARRLVAALYRSLVP
jgi:CubicO group peptidase (beta-lactamase class C family)